MEFLVELLLLLLQFLGEIVLQIILEGLVELGVRSIGEPFRRPQPLHPVMAAIGYAIFGAIAGGISIWVFHNSFIEPNWARVLNLIVTPLVAGATMALLGAWRRRRNQALIRLDRFSYGFLFAFSMALVRFIWAT